MVQINFNAGDYDPSTGGGDIFETGEYSFQIVKSEVKATKAGTGTMLVFEAACMDEGFSGKRLTIRLNIQNPNQTAMEIAYRDLSAICHVCGILQLQDTQQLHGRPFRVRLEKVERTDTPADQPKKFSNEIRGYLDMAGNPPTKGQAAGGGQAPGAPQPPAAPQPAAPAAPQPAPAAPAPAPAPAAAPAAPAAPPAPAPAPAPAAPAAATPPWAGAAPAAAPAAGAVPPWQQG